MTPTLHLRSPAKINLFLHITGKRADGYHNLQTVFRLIDFYDDMQFRVEKNPITKNETGLVKQNFTAPVNLHTDAQLTTHPADNLIIKAAQALYNFAQKEKTLSPERFANLPFIYIKLKKRIPTGAGLGGGSSNAATTLLALNQLWNLQLSKSTLQAIGVTLGADVPIFIYARDAIAEGIGEVFTPIDLPPQCFLLLTPNAHINTAELFAHPTLQRNCRYYPPADLLAQRQHFSDQLTADFCNVFEPVVRALSPPVRDALDYLHRVALHDLEKYNLEKLPNLPQLTARMSGSGSSVFLPLVLNAKNGNPLNWQNIIPTFLLETPPPCPAHLVTTLSADAVQQQITHQLATH